MVIQRRKLRKNSEPCHFIFESNKVGYIDLDNMGIEDKIVVGQVSVDIGKASEAVVQITYNCTLKYSIQLTEQLNLLFKLYRKDKKGNRSELASRPYSVKLSGDLGTESETVFISLQKYETFTLDFVDEIADGGLYTYMIEVNLIYNSVDEASILCGIINATGKACKCRC